MKQSFLILAAVAALPLAEVAQAASLIRHPHLQLMTSSSVTVVWKTDVAAKCSLALRRVGAAETTTVAGPTSDTCAIPLTGLTPGAEYGYVPRADGAPLLDESSFHTGAPDAPYTFLVFGDSGTGGAMQLAVRDRMLDTPADFILHTGDMVYDDGAAKDFDPKFFRPYRDLLRKVVLWPTLGNHDDHTKGGGPWRDAFRTPANNPAKSENYYSFDYGNAHVVVLNSNGNLGPGDPQVVFLDSDLAASNALWKFVVFHHSIYTSGEHTSALGIRASLVPIFDRHGVDVVFMGHDHDYERTVPLAGDLPTTAGAGTVYITTGGGGQRLRPVAGDTWTAYAEATFHFVRVSIDGDTLVLNMIREDGTVGDGWAKAKGTEWPLPRCGDGIVAPPDEQCDGNERFACAGPCSASCTCAPVCGDGVRNQASEACDEQDDDACPDRCLSDCRCGAASRFVTLEPVADTYIQDGAQSSWDHGAALELDTDLSPGTASFLKFDLTGLGRTVARAQLTLYCTNSSFDGGVVYPVSDSSWIEGESTGADATSALTPGLKWIEVDTNGDGRLDASDTSPWVPDASEMIGGMSCVGGQLMSVDVTHAISPLPGLATLAIKNGSSDGAAYASREHPNVARHPRLRVELTTVVVPTTTTTTIPTTTTTSTTTTTISTTTTSSTIATSTTVATTTSTTATLPPVTTTTSRPSTTSTSTSTTVTTTTTVQASTTSTTLPIARAIVQADVTVKEIAPDTNFGTEHFVESDAEPGERIFVRIGVTGVAGRPLKSVRLRLRVADTPGAPSEAGGRIRRVSACVWHERTITWSNQPVLDGAVLDAAPAVATGDLVDFDVTPAVGGDGVYCFAIDTDSDDGVTYVARESTANRPAVILELADGPTTTSIPTTSSSTSTTTSTIGTTTTTLPAVTTAVLADVSTRESEPTRNMGGATLLEADDSPRERTFLRVQVNGLAGRTVRSAHLRLKVAQPVGSASDSGGRIRRITDCSWSEMGVTWNTQPSLTGTVLATTGKVDYGDVIEFDVTPAITTNGVYCFALDTTSPNAVMYTSRETVTPPMLMIDAGP